MESLLGTCQEVFFVVRASRELPYRRFSNLQRPAFSCALPTRKSAIRQTGMSALRCRCVAASCANLVTRPRSAPRVQPAGVVNLLSHDCLCGVPWCGSLVETDRLYDLFEPGVLAQRIPPSVESQEHQSSIVNADPFLQLLDGLIGLIQT